jgi:protein-S-isoprenylcysteine O-methyltransferase Ste14
VTCSFDATGKDPPTRSPRPWRRLADGWLQRAGWFLVLESAVGQRGSASSLEDSTDDQGTTRLILGAYVVATALPPLLRPLRMRRLPRSAGPLGLAIEATGLGVRLCSMRTLRGSYSRTLGTTAEQTVINDGSCRLIRHPGYLGSMLIWAGCTLTSGSLPTVFAVTGLLVGAYRRRISPPLVTPLQSARRFLRR